MKEPTRFGGTAAILLGLSYVALAAAHLFLPPAQQGGSASAGFFRSFAADPLPSMLQYTVAALGAVLGLAVVPAISGIVRARSTDLVRWASALAYLGFAAVLFDSVRFLTYQPARAALFAAGDATVQTTVLVSDPLLYLDAQGWFGFGGVGLWVAIISFLAWREGRFGHPLACLGMAVAAAYWIVVAGFVTTNELLFTAAAVAGSVVGPIWFVWLGLRLLSQPRHVPLEAA